MKKKEHKEILFTKATIAILNQTSLYKVMGGNNSEIDPTETSIFYSEGPPSTALGVSG